MWLITGGAGYIGSHIVKAFQKEKVEVAIVDNFSTGKKSFLNPETNYEELDILDTESLSNYMKKMSISGVIHLAGYKYAGESVKYPLTTYMQNFNGTLSVLLAMQKNNVKNIVFSSSAAVYGNPGNDKVTEGNILNPESPYGRSKLFAEKIIKDYGAAEGINHVSLRYFNVVGSGYSNIVDISPHNLIPIVNELLLENKTPRVNGIDYESKDGSCIRDYVHVSDLAHSHLIAAQKLSNNEKLKTVYNLGSGNGSSVLEIMKTAAEVSKIDFTPEIGPRRPGDPAVIVAEGTEAEKDLEWKMRHSLFEMIKSDWVSRKILKNN